MGSHLFMNLRCSSSTESKFFKIIHFSNQYDSPHPLFISSNILKINELHKLQLASFGYESTLHHLVMKVLCSKIHMNSIIISAVPQKYTPMQQGNPVAKNSSSHVKTQLSMAYSQSVMLELLSGTIFPRISEVDNLFIVSNKNILLACISNCYLFLSSICRVSQRGVEKLQGGLARVGWVDGLWLVGRDSTWWSVLNLSGLVWSLAGLWAPGGGAVWVEAGWFMFYHLGCCLTWCAGSDSFHLGMGTDWSGMLCGTTARVADDGPSSFSLDDSFFFFSCGACSFVNCHSTSRGSGDDL